MSNNTEQYRTKNTQNKHHKQISCANTVICTISYLRPWCPALTTLTKRKGCHRRDSHACLVHSRSPTLRPSYQPSSDTPPSAWPHSSKANSLASSRSCTPSAFSCITSIYTQKRTVIWPSYKLRNLIRLDTRAAPELHMLIILVVGIEYVDEAVCVMINAGDDH